MRYTPKLLVLPTATPAPRFLFVDDQGGVFSSYDDPTVEDFAFAAVGMLTIIRLADLHSYSGKQRWQAIPISRLTTVTLGNDPGLPFHSTDLRTNP